ncbi:MAG: molybdopterin-binding protein [Xanthobacteraceae bacterium]
MAAEHDPQQMTRLTPLAEVTARIDALVKQITPRRVAVATALGRVLSEDVVAGAAVPASARALRDGFAVAAEALSDASSYAPVQLVPPQRVDAGEVLPAGTDAVAPLDTVVERDGRFSSIAPVAPGDGVLTAGGDVGAGTLVRRAGTVVRATDLAALAAAGIAEVAVCAPRVCVAPARAGHDPIITAAVELLAGAVAAAGGVVRRCADGAAALTDAEADAIIVLGGTGVGRRDTSVRALAAVGEVNVRGVALMPGETAAFGMVGQRPVLLVPGRLDAALAVWLTLGRHLLVRLTGGSGDVLGTSAALARKHASPLGLAEVVPVHLSDGQAEPIASGYWPLQAMARANGWILVPGDSEGYPAGAEVVIRALP